MKSTQIRTGPLAAIAAVVGLSIWTVTGLEAANPVLPVGGADPHAALFNGRCYIYATGAGATEEGFAVWSSSDLATWKNEGMVLKFADLNWTPRVDKNAWAPGIIERDGKYFFYFSADSRIGVAVSDSPTGPFKDPLGQPLIPYRDDLSVIDPMAFIDDDGQAYLYWGAVPASWLKGKVEKIYNHLFVRKLNRDMVSFAGEEIATVESVGPHIEGSWMLKRNGTYYLMWSAGNWDSGAGEHAYRVEYATARSPLGPFTRAKNNPVLATDPEQQIVGPGHHSVLHIPGTDSYYIVYHAHRGKEETERRVFIDALRFEADGSIAKVRPTRTGVGAVQLSKPQGPPKARHACDPAEGFYPDYPHAWRQILGAQIQRAKEGNAPLVFLGDSLVQGWGEQPRWKEHYSKLGAVNFGVGGDGTPQLLYRIQQGILDGLNPKVVVLSAGVNNVWPGFDATDTIAGLKAVVASIQAKAPSAKILLVSNWHFFDKGDGGSRRRVDTINAALKEMSDRRNVRFLDLSEQLLKSDRELESKYYAADKLHLSTEGYRLWAQAMDPVLQEMLQ